MAEEARIEVTLDLDSKKFKSSLNKAEKSSKESGRKAGRNFGKSFENSLGTLLKTVAGVGAALASAFTVKEALDAAIRQENAVNKLNQSLASIGEFSADASKELQDYAASLQKVSTEGDEVILETIALAQAMGATKDQSKEIAAAALDLSTAYGTSLETATRNITKTLSGLTGELGEQVGAIRGLTTEQLKAGAAIGVIRGQFAGFAGAEIRTFGGAIKQVRGLIGDLLEQIGNFIIKSPVAVALILKFRDGVVFLIDKLKDLGGGDVVKGILENITKVIRVIGTFILAIVPTPDKIVFLFRIFKGIFNGLIKLARIAVNEIFGAVGGLFEKIFVLAEEKLGVGGGLARFFKGEKDAALKEVETLKGELNTLFEDVSINDLFVVQFNAALDSFEKFLEDAGALTEELKKIFKNMKKEIEGTANDIKTTVDAINNAITRAIVTSISEGAQRLGAALAGVENTFDDFGKFLLGVLGDLAIQVGELLLFFAIAFDALKASFFTLGTGVLVAAAIGLIVAGGFLKAIASKGDATGDTSPGGGGFAGEEEQEEAVEAEAGPTTEINVIVQGSVFDTTETGLRIVDIIQDAFDEQGTVVKEGFQA